MTMPTDLAALSAAATQQELSEEGHYFSDTLCDLASCSHGETAYYNNCHDGPFIAALWNAYRTGNLVQIDREGMRERVIEAMQACDPVVSNNGYSAMKLRRYADAAIAAILGGE